MYNNHHISHEWHDVFPLLELVLTVAIVLLEGPNEPVSFQRTITVRFAV